MILTDTDRRNLLARYRRLRAKSPNPPATIMEIIRDCAAEHVCQDVANERTPWPQDVRDWAIAAEYSRTMLTRPDYWRLGPR